MTVLELLIATRERILESKKWARMELARDPNFRKCSVNSSNARSWSLSGALLLEGLGIPKQRIRAAEIIRDIIDSDHIQEWNDHVGHKDVINVLTRAIEETASKEKVFAEPTV